MLAEQTLLGILCPPSLFSSPSHAVSVSPKINKNNLKKKKKKNLGKTNLALAEGKEQAGRKGWQHNLGEIRFQEN